MYYNLPDNCLKFKANALPNLLSFTYIASKTAQHLNVYFKKYRRESFKVC